ncbi:MAG: tetratricopeptide repeat protein [Burkholderiaceae bacterium]|jgi:cytochrome c-type biogenesis protein CcmH|nr:tetratricopeptide repeat protein [Burkholderiaceae bacterium]
MQNSGLLANWIELRVMLAGRKFDARTQELVSRAATLAPDDPEVMLLGALAAYARGDKASADALVGKLHQRYPPGTPDRQSLDAMLEQWASPKNQLPVMPSAPSQSASASAADTPDINAMVQRLADRLKQHPEDMDGWLMLARSYSTLGRYADAEAAYEHAQTRVMQDSGLLIGWIELRLKLSGGQFDARTLELINRAAALTPDDSDVLLLRALAAYARGDKASADALVDKLHQRYPPGTPERQGLDAALKKMMPHNKP